MTATKIQPGNDTHLTLLMAPHSLNLVTGADRAALLAYGRDVFAAGREAKCLAQIQEPAQPVAEICSASHDGAEFGERSIKLLCDISGFEYGTPLYAGAAPATVVLQREYPAINPKDFDSDSDLWCYIDAWHHSKPGKESGENAYLVCGHIQRLMRAYFDLGRKPATTAPALEAPAAPALPADEFRGDTPSLVRNILALLKLDAEGALVPHGIGGHARSLLSAAAARLAAAPQAPAAPVSSAEAMAVLKAAFAVDPEYAWSWHCAVWSCVHDEGLATDAANRAAARLMYMAFGCDTSKNQHFCDEHRVATPAVDASELEWLTKDGRAHGFRVLQTIEGAVITHSTESLRASIAAAQAKEGGA